MGITIIYEDLYMGWIKTWTLGMDGWTSSARGISCGTPSELTTPNTPSHGHHCHWIGYRSYAMVNRILDPKKYPKMEKNCMVWHWNHPKSNKPAKHLQCSPTLDIVSYIVSYTVSYIVSYIVSAICIQCVLAGRQKSGLAGRLQWRSVEPSSLCPFRPRCHHFRPCPFLSLLRFYTFHLPSSVAPGRWGKVSVWKLMFWKYHI